ncbi:SnoaL-domain-containing protein [Hypoxylon trugodes]|uniref:SnoaL-domain-containing protein n=1 Tax=Hypoxylon trugodes TaxID=326681 RepID=UPI00219C13B0|nr:SnoaL-domain-containing protein [Hypoxylon trugodes]KAI1384412.1 SnoaL-domain-containing protein [Hypoxylon trugodes]
MADIEATYKSLIQCANERKWEDLAKYMNSHFTKDGQDSTLESYATYMKSTGNFKANIDSITVDRHSQRLGATVLVDFKFSKANDEGTKSAGRTISFLEQQIIWFVEGKVAKVFIVADRDEMHRHISDPSVTFTPDLIREYKLPSATSGIKLSASKLEDTYRTYIRCINAQTMETDLRNFCHSQVVHNTKTLTEEGYRLLIQEAFTAIPDITFDLHTVIADEEAQRVAARIEFTGKPVGMLMGAKPNGRAVNFCEHVTYQFMDGKIARVWSIVDWPSYRAQLQPDQQ